MFCDSRLNTSTAAPHSPVGELSPSPSLLPSLVTQHKVGAAVQGGQPPHLSQKMSFFSFLSSHPGLPTGWHGRAILLS